MYRAKIVKAGYLPFHEILSRVILFCFVRVSLTGSKLVVLAVRVDFVTRACLLSRASLRNIYIYTCVHTRRAGKELSRYVATKGRAGWEEAVQQGEEGRSVVTANRIAV